MSRTSSEVQQGSLWCGVLALVLLGGPAAALGQAVSYQGYLTDIGGEPINETLSMEFGLYPQSDGGPLLWGEVQEVEIVEGVFRVLLGDVTPLPPDPPGALFLEVTVDGDVQSPRSAVTAAVFALRAGVADDVPGRDITPRTVSIQGVGEVISDDGVWRGGLSFQDSDDDGFSDVTELLVGTDPLDRFEAPQDLNEDNVPDVLEGPAGRSCSVVQEDGGATIDCDDGSRAQVSDGREGARGPQGPEGPVGAASLINTFEEPPGDNCAHGGSRIEHGVDDNRDGLLLPVEVQATRYVCNGAPADNQGASTILTAPSPNSQCTEERQGHTIYDTTANGMRVCDGQFWRAVGGVCGDGNVEGGEECDDANTNVDDGCVFACVRGGFEGCNVDCDVAGSLTAYGGGGAKVVAGDGTEGDQFGRSVALSGGFQVVGALLDDDRGINSGSAYVFVEQNGDWVQGQKLVANDGAEGDEFGSSVAAAEGVIVVGAPIDDLGRGGAYVFDLQNDVWAQAQKLTANDGAAGDNFGYALAVSGDVIVIGAYDNDDRGAAYVFEKQNNVWGQVQKLTASDGAAGDRFGYALAVSGDVIVIGAFGDDDRGENSGSAYVFERRNDVWEQTQKLTADDDANGDEFGRAVSVSNGVVAIGAINDDDLGDQSGSAYVFERREGRWSQLQKLTASDGTRFDYFGESVSVSDDVIVIGASQDDDLGSASGGAYVFRRLGSRWTQIQKLTAADGVTLARFGLSVSVAGDVVSVGAYGDGGSRGGAYIFEAQPLCTSQGRCICERGRGGADCSTSLAQ